MARNLYGQFMAALWAKMSRWRRWVNTTLTVAGLACFVAWPVSHLTNFSNWDRSHRGADIPQTLIELNRGMLSVKHWLPIAQQQAVRDDRWWFDFLGFSCGFSGTFAPPGAMLINGIYYFVYLPLWMPAVLLVFYPMARLYVADASFWRAYNRREQGLCVECRYDLRGCVENICPECGTPPDESFGHHAPNTKDDVALG